MKQEEIFGSAEWVCAGKYENTSVSKTDPNGVPNYPILRRKFNVTDVKSAKLYVIGLGTFKCFINGTEVTEDKFLPLSTDYEVRENYPTEEKLHGHRIYVPNYEVGSLLREGENVLAIHFGGGWYTYDGGKFGMPKAIYRLVISAQNGTEEITSGAEDKIGDSYVKTGFFTAWENQDFTGYDDRCMNIGFDDSMWKNAVPAQPLDTEYLISDCPADRIVKSLDCTLMSDADGVRSYDCSSNVSGWPIVRIKAAAGEKVIVRVSEERTPDGKIDGFYNWSQNLECISDGKERVIHPEFSWFAFRYISVEGNGELERVDVIHSDIRISSAFESDNENLNWLYKTYLNTQLDNMHAGIPSDCPHIERRGYTGDGELACHASMDCLDAKKFYQKWIEDISDCQDDYSGHVQYTAPYLQSGGGPGAWGCAIVEVPYQYYKHYGDIEPCRKLYGQMLRYFDYLEAHSDNNLVVSDKKGQWCLGDWLPPMQVVIPAPFVNNYYYIKSMKEVIEIAKVIGRETEIPVLEKRIEVRKQAIMDAYFGPWDGNFVGCIQGANAFAIDLGLGEQRTYNFMKNYYTELNQFDTGICGTDVLIRTLFEHGDYELATQLLASDEDCTFAGMKRKGATTLWENWPNVASQRSHNHPMFGAVTAYLFDFILGFRQKQGTAGWSELVIDPQISHILNHVSGSRELPDGKISAVYDRDGEKINAKITLTGNIRAVFRHGETETALVSGENEIVF